MQLQGDLAVDFKQGEIPRYLVWMGSPSQISTFVPGIGKGEYTPSPILQ